MRLTDYLDRDSAFVVFGYLDYNSIVSAAQIFDNTTFFLQWNYKLFGPKLNNLKAVVLHPKVSLSEPSIPIQRPKFIFETGKFHISEIRTTFYMIRLMICPKNNIQTFLRQIYCSLWTENRQVKNTPTINYRKGFNLLPYPLPNGERSCSLPFLIDSIDSLVVNKMYHNMKIQITQCSRSQMTLRSIAIQKDEYSAWEPINYLTKHIK